MKDWHPERIKAAIREAGTTLTQLSVDAGFNPCAVSQTLKKPWPAVESVVARYLGTEPWRIWPSRYRDGKPTFGGRFRRARTSQEAP